MSHKITVVGLGYVGMSMSVLLSRDHDVIAFDIDKKRLMISIKVSHQLKIRI